MLVETPEGALLWDTSWPRDWETRWEPTGLHEFFPDDQVSEERYLDSRLGQLGVGPERLDEVVLSHLHFDHAGNVRMFAGTGAKLVCNDKEKEFAATSTASSPGPTSRSGASPSGATRPWSSRTTRSSCGR